MPLVDVPYTPADGPLPPDVRAFIDDAEERIQRILDERRGNPIHGFVPSDFIEVYRALEGVARLDDLPNRSFCEWGAGIGVVAGLAAMLDFDACGIEIQSTLVEEAESLVADFDLPVAFACGTYIPAGHESCFDSSGSFAWVDEGGDDAYRELGLDPRDFDVVFAYPWPGEEHAIRALFDAVAAPGALLVLHRGLEDLQVVRRDP